MPILKCKMCGGDIELSADKTFGTCESCGSTMTFPKVDDEQRASMFNRGNHFRRMGEFDKALAVYERIVQEDENDAEAHWCCALCRFGIEYVEDPNTFEYLPTCHRASFDSFLEDVDYLAALEHSDGITRRQYQKDAAKIAEVQRGILATSQNEEPFDVFICYKESENDGTRTRDSLMAQEIYYQLTEQGRRVFFSRITLEDKAGTEYEPYIFAALNSAKVMIVVTTSAEHVNAVWVKNEWSRFLSLMRKDRSKLLLPCYRDMDPYDLPEALSVLQSYDMGKIGFIQDLTRGVNKVLSGSKPRTAVTETVVLQQTQNMVAPLLERAFMFLEDGNWESANEYCEKVLDQNPKNAEAYLGKLMAELHIRTPEGLKDTPQPFDDRDSYKKALRFGDGTLKEKLSNDLAYIRNREITARNEPIYQNALIAMREQTESGYCKAAELFASIANYKDSGKMHLECKANAVETRNQGIYQYALIAMRKQTEQGYRKAAELFASIAHYLDADKLRIECESNAEETRKQGIYQKALNAMQEQTEQGYHKAAELFVSVAGYKDADKLRVECETNAEETRKQGIYQNALNTMNTAKTELAFRSAAAVFKTIPGFKDSESLAEECLDKAERAKGRALAIAGALMEGKKSKGIRPIEERLAVANTKTQELERILNTFDSAKTQIKILQSELDSALFQEKQLSEQRMKLGIFSGKEKKRIDKELAVLSVKKKDITDRIDQQQNTIGHYVSFADIKHDFNEASKNAKHLKFLMDSVRTYSDKEYSFDEALHIYLNEPDVAIDVYNFYPEADRICKICALEGSTNTIRIGRYIQKKDGSPEPIEWQVIARENGRVLIVSKYLLDYQKYNVTNTNVSWETCSLRKWLNGTFLSSAFSSEEQNLIIKTRVTADKNPEYSTSPGNDTTDQVFLLSITEAKKYFHSDEGRKCVSSEYVASRVTPSRNSDSAGNSALCWWWLRSPGTYPDLAACVNIDGSVRSSGSYVGYVNGAVRPAMWIDLSEGD